VLKEYLPILKSDINTVTVGTTVTVFISDCHRGIPKWIGENQAGTLHFFDIWHIACFISKAMLKLSKENGYHNI